MYSVRNDILYLALFLISLNKLMFYCIIMIFSVYFPQESGLYPAVLFLPGLNGYVLAEFYETVLFRIASHGFFVFGLDYKFPMEQVKNEGNNLEEDIDKFFQHYDWVCCIDLFRVICFQKEYYASHTWHSNHENK